MKNAGLFNVSADEIIKYSLHGQTLGSYLTGIQDCGTKKWTKIVEMNGECLKLIVNTTSAAIKAVATEKKYFFAFLLTI